jgi:hypothetical protein
MLDGGVGVDENDKLVGAEKLEENVWFYPGVMQSVQLFRLDEAVIVVMDLC